MSPGAPKLVTAVPNIPSAAMKPSVSCLSLISSLAIVIIPTVLAEPAGPGSSPMVIKIGRWGQLPESQRDLDDPDDQHRRTSDLFAVYLGPQIPLKKTPELAKSPSISLRSRSGNCGKKIDKPFTVDSTIGDNPGPGHGAAPCGRALARAKRPACCCSPTPTKSSCSLPSPCGGPRRTRSRACAYGAGSPWITLGKTDGSGFPNPLRSTIPREGAGQWRTAGGQSDCQSTPEIT
jgi:hypothetical protein